jgi:amino acid adenylation domain-containing protein
VRLSLEEVDLSRVDERLREQELKELERGHARRGFDLSAGPLMRVRLLRVGPEEHRLLLAMHHIISDGWSMGVFIREVTLLYEEEITGDRAKLPEMIIQYADYSAWQREWLQGEVLEKELAYWRKQLAGSARVLELPADRSRSAIQTYGGGHKSLLLPKNLSERIKGLGRRESSTLFMTLLSAFNVLLYRYSGQNDILIGSPIFGRNRAETEGMIGCFLNTLVLRTTLSSELSFLDVLNQVRETTLGAYSHQDLPFEKIVEELEPQRDLSRTPLFQVMFNMLNFADQPINPHGLTVEILPSLDVVSKFDLTFYAAERNDSIFITAVFSADLFDDVRIGALLSHFHVLLEAIVTDPWQRIANLPLLTDDEKRERSLYGNIVHPANPFNEFTIEETEQSIYRRFEKQVKKYPKRIAVKTMRFEWTYEALDEIVNRMAGAILAQSGKEEERIALLFRHDAPMIAGILATLKVGKTYVPLDPSYPKGRLTYILEDAQSATLLTDDSCLDLAQDLKSEKLRVITADSDDTTLPLAEGGFDVSPDTLAYILYTSGSTGRPKGVVQNHRNVLRHIRNYTNNLHICVDDGLALLASYSFDAAVMDIFGALLNGATLYPMDVKEYSLADLSKWLVQQETTIYHSTPTVYRYFFGNQPWTNRLPNIRLVVLGGEEVRPGDIRLYKDRFSDECILVNGLGPTESTLSLQYFINKQTEVTRNTVPVGWPVDGIQVHLLNGAGEQVAIYGIGEIAVRGAHIALGYWNNAEMSNTAFLPDPDSGDRRIYRTGDLGRLLPDSSIEFIGRKDNQVKIRGFRIEMGEIEAELTRHPRVKEAVVKVWEVAGVGKRLVAYLVTGQGEELNVSEIRRYLSDRVPEYMVPSSYVTLREMPLTNSGKVDRGKLPEPDLARPELAHEYEEPETEIERALSRIWGEVLGIDQVGNKDNFFELGGHSLLAVQVVSRVRMTFEVEIGVKSIFKEPTVAALARRIDGMIKAGEKDKAPPLVRVSREGRLQLSFAQQRLWIIDQLAPNNPFYNCLGAVRLEGRLDLAALERAINEIIRRHEVLRTRVEVEAEEPVQIIDEWLPRKLEVEDLRSLSQGEREAEVARMALEEAQTGFDLRRGPLLRVKILKLGVEEHVMFYTMHHIVSDRWSMGILIREVEVLYRAFIAGEPSPLKELPIQYADFSVWQRELLNGPELERELAYWRGQLAGVKDLELPFDHPRPTEVRYRGAQERFLLEKELVAGLRELSSKEAVTLFTTLFAAFQTLLYRYTGQKDIVVGAPIANRNKIELEGLIGFFVNTLALRTRLSSDISFRDLLRQTQETALAAYSHSQVPFEKLVEELSPKRSIGQNPLFQVWFFLDDMAFSENLVLPGITLSRVNIDASAARLDLALTMSAFSNDIVGAFTYDTDLFETSTMITMTERFHSLLKAVVRNPDQRLIDIPIADFNENRESIEINRLALFDKTQADFVF